MATGGRLKDRVAIVTGAARGIGQSIAARLALEGARVVVADIDGTAAAESASAIAHESGSEVFAIKTDISDPVSAAAMVSETVRRWNRLDILVNNGAILDSSPFGKLTYERFQQVMRVNLDGALICTVAAVRHLSRSSTARILNVASLMGLRGSRDSIPYSTAKGGLVNLTRCLACDLSDKGILVNAIAPGYIDTRMARLPDGSHEHDTEWFKDVYLKHRRLPIGRAGTPEDIAGPAFFFCSDDSRYVTGQIMVVDGGVSATF
jgi:NAD(P)-dependent dehydrogenase (short-subunit alcohol dehydrogenase family)